MKKAQIGDYRPVYPSPAALVTSVDPSGRANIITLGEVFNVSIRNPVIIGISIRPATYSYGLITAQREFVVNLPTAAIAAKVDGCGSVSGRNGLDKFAEFGLTPMPARSVKPPLIEECPVNIECHVLSVTRVGDHDLILGKVVAVHADEDKIDSRGRVSSARLDMLVYFTDEYWSAGGKIADHGFSTRKPTGAEAPS